MNKNDLYKNLVIKEKQVDNAQFKRTVIAFISFSVFYFFVLMITIKPVGLWILGALVGSLLLGFFHFLINGIIFSLMYQKNANENAMLDSLRKEISDLEQRY